MNGAHSRWDAAAFACAFVASIWVYEITSHVYLCGVTRCIDFKLFYIWFPIYSDFSLAKIKNLLKIIQWIKRCSNRIHRPHIHMHSEKCLRQLMLMSHVEKRQLCCLFATSFIGRSWLMSQLRIMILCIHKTFVHLLNIYIQNTIYIN